MSVAGTVAESRLEFEAMYAAITGRDTRFDGTFYTAVRTTGVYCRPSCPARKPRRQNVTFYASAAAAQSAGYRACRRCVPEALPGSPLWNVPGSLCARALQLIDSGVVDDEGVQGLARRLGWSSRTITRAMVEQTGATPLAHARARRARLAHALITGTADPLTDVAFAAGFASVRQFNDTIRAVYGVAPTQLRASRSSGVVPGTLQAALPYRPPLHWAGLLEWFGRRALPGVDHVADGRYRVALALPNGPAVAELADDGSRNQVVAVLDLEDLRDYGPACAVLRRLLDLDADPIGIDAHLAESATLAPLVHAAPGTRIPGTPTSLEALLRALTGQQVSVTAGLAQLHRLVGPPPADGSQRPFPTAGEILAGGLDWFRGPRSRRATIASALELAATGALDPAVDVHEVADALATVRGIGPWTIAYTLLRGYGLPDVDLSGDRAVVNAVRRLTGQSAREVLAEAAPWRSYAALHLWNHVPRPS